MCFIRMLVASFPMVWRRRTRTLRRSDRMASCRGILNSNQFGAWLHNYKTAVGFLPVFRVIQVAVERRGSLPGGRQ